MTQRRRWCTAIVDRDGRVCNKRIRITLGPLAELDLVRLLEADEEPTGANVELSCLDGHRFECRVVTCRAA